MCRYVWTNEKHCKQHFDCLSASVKKPLCNLTKLKSLTVRVKVTVVLQNAHGLFSDVGLELTHNLMLYRHSYITVTVSSNLIVLLHKDFPRPPPSLKYQHKTLFKD